MPIALVDRLRALPRADREAIYARCTAKQLAALQWEWERFWARPDEREPGAIEGRGQLPPPGRWKWWANIGGRGGGKTMACAQWVSHQALTLPGVRIHLVAPTVDHARDVMVEGDKSGLLAVSPPWADVHWYPSIGDGKVQWGNGSTAHVYSVEKPRRQRGPECSRIWIDDAAAFGPKAKAAIDVLLYGFRKRAPDGSAERGVVSTSPIDNEFINWLLAASYGGRRSRVVFSRSTTDDNRVNLTEGLFEETMAEFAGTEMEQFERYGAYDPRNAPRVFQGINFQQYLQPGLTEYLVSVAVWIDPALSTSTRSCEVGMIVAGLTASGTIVLLEDCSARMGANEWPARAHEALERWQASAQEAHFGVEVNRGTDQPPQLLRAEEQIRRMARGEPRVSVIPVRTVFAHRSKVARAQPLPGLYRAGVVRHLPGLEVLERQLRELKDPPQGDVDRADAAVYAVLDLAGILDKQDGYTVGGSVMAPFVTPAPQGAVQVGPVVTQPVQPFQFSQPARR